MSTRSTEVTYSGEMKPLFKLAFMTGLLTVVTLGIYRFWAKTRIRKYLWSSAGIDGDRFEYTGTGLEKFLGFLVAVVLLAIYLGIVQLVLTYFGLGLVLQPTTQAEAIAQILSIYISLFAVFPFMLFATYRAQRYRLARTRFRGIRFGMDSAAWGYAFRAMGYYLLVILTLGILMPLASFKLSKFMTDRSWYGDAKFEQTGKWTALYPPMLHLLIGVIILIAAIFLAETSEFSWFSVLLLIVGYIWMIFGLLYYNIRSFVYLMNNMTLASDVTFTARASVKTVLLRAFGGILLVGIIAIAGFALLGVVGSYLSYMLGSSTEMTMGQILLIAFIVLAYMALLIALGALSLVFITQPILAHLLNTLEIGNAEVLANVQQRAHDKGADAEGFAEALDIGGAI
ncbi:MAG: YjgN family protein [Pseudorhodobacter sp.]